jgi:hypothetical protein
MGCFSSKPDDADPGASAVKSGYVPSNADGGGYHAGGYHAGGYHAGGGHHTYAGDGGGGGGGDFGGGGGGGC